jgi:transcriptional regulator GlxA family with amidase domain
MRRVVVLGLQSSLASFISGPLDIFAMVGVLWNRIQGEEAAPRFEVEVVSQDGRPISCANGTALVPHGSLARVRHADLVIVSSAGLDVDGVLSTHRRAIRWLARLHGKGATLASVCTGAFLLAETGLLDGRTATTHWGFADEFRRRYPRVRLMAERTITDEGDLLCAGGADSGLWLCLHLIERELGHEVAAQTAKAFLLDLRPPPQQSFIDFRGRRGHGDAQVALVQDRLELRFAQGLTLEGLAAEAGMSPRNLHRRFKAVTGEAPRSYLQRVRIEAAKRLLERTRNGIEQIGYEVGYSDSRFFRRLFRKLVGTGPASYRKRFRRGLDPRLRPSRIS